MFAHRNIPHVMAAALALASIPVAAGATGVATCEQLEQRCEASVSSLRDVLAHVSEGQIDSAAALDNLRSYDCHGRYAEARESGVFPGRTPEPNLPCTN